MRKLSTTSGNNPNVITSAPSCQDGASTQLTDLSFEPNIQDQHHARSFFGSFRTHINLPFQVFQSHSFKSTLASEKCTCPIIPLNAIDIESQSSSQGHAIIFQPLTHATVETQIWATQPHLKCQTRPQASEPARGSTCGFEDSGVDEGPKMGTRAYRERERREMEALRREQMSGRDEVVVSSSVIQSLSWSSSSLTSDHSLIPCLTDLAEHGRSRET